MRWLALSSFCAVALVVGCGGGGAGGGSTGTVTGGTSTTGTTTSTTTTGTTGSTDGTIRVEVRYPNADWNDWQHQNQGPTVKSWIRCVTWQIEGVDNIPKPIPAQTLSEHALSDSVSITAGTYTVHLRAYERPPSKWPDPPEPLLGEATAQVDVTVGQEVLLTAATALNSYVASISFDGDPYHVDPNEEKSFPVKLLDGMNNVLLRITAEQPGFVWFVVQGHGAITLGGRYRSDIGTSTIRVQDIGNDESDQCLVKCEPPPPPP